MPSLSDIPVEIFIDNLLPLISLKDLLSLTCVNKDFSTLCSDDTFWKRKVNEDYNFSDSSSARTKGYKFLYKGIHRSQVYVWGEAANDRLGLQRQHLSRRNSPILYSGEPYPRQLRISGVRLVDIVAGGWSFHALDSNGSVHVWGTLDSQNYALENDPFSISGKRVPTPIKLQLSERIIKISCGRAHSMALTETNRVLVFTNWGTPHYLESSVISNSSVFTTPLQVECGWSLSAVLTKGGEVYVWWPRKGLFKEQIRQHDMSTEQLALQGQRIDGNNGVVECVPWEISTDPYPLRDVDDDLPKLHPDAPPDHTKIVKIAAGDGFIIGLTKGGHILKVGFPGEEESFMGPPMMRPRWSYLSRFSEVTRISEYPGLQNNITSASSLQMTHISAHFNTFFAYSTGGSSIVLRGSKDTTITMPPEIMPGLQNRNIIAVVLGDYHFAALTSTGKLLTWGQYSSGALGLGDPTKLPAGTPGGYANERDKSVARVSPPPVSEPTEVKFGTKDYGQGRHVFVFGVTACGWHTGALVIDLDDPGYEESGEEDNNPLTPPHAIHEPGSFLPGAIRRGNPFRSPFRVGLAGAHRGRGRGVDG